jgi:hypothetical protein
MEMTKEEFERFESEHKFYQSILKHNPEINTDLKEKFQMKSMIYQYEIDKRKYEERIQASRQRRIFWVLFCTPIAIVIFYIFIQSILEGKF